MSDMYDAEGPKRRPRESKKSSPADADWLTGRSWDDIRAQLAESQRTGAKRPTGEPGSPRVSQNRGGARPTQPPRRTGEPAAPRGRKRPPAPANPANAGRGGAAKGRPAAGRPQPVKKPTVAGKPPRPGAGSRKKQAAQPASSPRNLWQNVKFWGRRIGIGLLVTAVFVGVLFGVFYVEKQLSEYFGAQSQVDTLQVNDEALAVPLCQPGDLDVQVTTNASTLQTGSHWKVKLVIKNKSARACYTEGGPNRFGISLKSGEVSVYESQKCAAKDGQIPLLLNPQKSWQMDLTWDARVWTNCQAGDVAKPGTYVATIFNQDKLVGEPHVLTVVPRPEPKPEPKPADKPAEKPADKPAEKPADKPA
ncbi:MAG: hypothetical protein Q4D73_03915 [Actinomycetaceae bacterium]|nr:hypothetical protein [Actinomycetaceae bacterium]